MLYHLIIAVSGIALLLCGWVWAQKRVAREECQGLADEAVCTIGFGCHRCARAANANDRREGRGGRDAVFPGEQAQFERSHPVGLNTDRMEGNPRRNDGIVVKNL